MDQTQQNKVRQTNTDQNLNNTDPNQPITNVNEVTTTVNVHQKPKEKEENCEQEQKKSAIFCTENPKSTIEKEEKQIELPQNPNQEEKKIEQIQQQNQNKKCENLLMIPSQIIEIDEQMPCPPNRSQVIENEGETPNFGKQCNNFPIDPQNKMNIQKKEALKNEIQIIDHEKQRDCGKLLIQQMPKSVNVSQPFVENQKKVNQPQEGEIRDQNPPQIITGEHKKTEVINSSALIEFSKMVSECEEKQVHCENKNESLLCLDKKNIEIKEPVIIQLQSSPEKAEPKETIQIQDNRMEEEIDHNKPVTPIFNPEQNIQTQVKRNDFESMVDENEESKKKFQNQNLQEKKDIQNQQKNAQKPVQISQNVAQSEQNGNKILFPGGCQKRQGNPKMPVNMEGNLVIEGTNQNAQKIANPQNVSEGQKESADESFNQLKNGQAINLSHGNQTNKIIESSDKKDIEGQRIKEIEQKKTSQNSQLNLKQILISKNGNNHSQDQKNSLAHGAEINQRLEESTINKPALQAAPKGDSKPTPTLSNSFSADTPELTDINQIRKVLLISLPPHIREIAQNLDDSQLREMYLQIRAEEAKLSSTQNQTKGIQTKKQCKSTKEKKKHRKNEHKSSTIHEVQEEKADGKKNGCNMKQIKPRKKIITTIVQQIEYFQSDEDEPRSSKISLLDNGEIKRKNVASEKKNNVSEKISQVSSIIRNLNLSSMTQGPMH